MRRIDYLNKKLSKLGIAVIPHMAGLPNLEQQEEFISWRDEEVNENGKPVNDSSKQTITEDKE